MPRGRIKNHSVRKGQRPTAEDARLLGTHEDGWELWAYRVSMSEKRGKPEQWVNLKLTNPAGYARKANYWLAYCVTRQDFGLTRDYKIMDEVLPDMAVWIEAKVLETYDPVGALEALL